MDVAYGYASKNQKYFWTDLPTYNHGKKQIYNVK